MIYAIVSIYNPSDSVCSNIINICNQADHTFLCDNSCKNSRELFAKMEKSTYLFWGENLGLSKAFNKILKETKYKFKEDDFFVFFDQDSSIDENHISNLIKDYQMLEGRGYKIGCLGPIFFNSSRGEIEVAKNKKLVCENCYSVQSMITSSMLCKYKQIKKIGFWNDEIFLDMADWDLCWRFIEQNYLCCITKNVLLYHSVGESEKKVGPFRMRVGKTFREYYQVRDSLYLLKKKYVPFRFRIKLIQVVTIRIVTRLLFLENKKERLFYIKLGIRDFIKGRHGSLT